MTQPSGQGKSSNGQPARVNPWDAAGITFAAWLKNLGGAMPSSPPPQGPPPAGPQAASAPPAGPQAASGPPRGPQTAGARAGPQPARPRARRARQARAAPQAVGGANLSDLGNAQRLVTRFGGEIRHCHPWKQDLVWDNWRWRADDTAQAERFAKETIRQMYLEAQGLPDDERVALTKHALKSEDSRRLRAMVSLARSESGVPILPATLDADPYLFNCANGTIDLRTGLLRPHRPADLITKLAPLVFDETATCPLWLKFLDQIMGGNKALVGYLQRFTGYCLSGDVSEQCLLFLYGTGANGKSTFLNTLLPIFGDYGLQAVSDLLLAKHHESHPTERADLFGRRFVITIETEDGRRIAEALMKQLTGGDRIRARHLYQDSFEFAPTHKILLAANHKPKVRGTDHAAWRRIKLLPFTVTISEQDKDRNLPRKLARERIGILSWAVAGCLEWQRYGLQEPAEVQAATAAYRAEEDVVQGFLNECCVLNPTASANSTVLFNAFMNWAGDKTMTPLAFRKRLNDKGFQSSRGTNGYYFWDGLGLV
jgi:putative DNA primase/helicase